MTSLDEIPFEFDVSDDFGLQSHGIQYEVAGQDPVRVALSGADPLGSTSAGRHTLQLETLELTPGDLVTCTVPPNLPHIMIVSDKKSADGTPLVIHNIGRGAREENRLFEFPLTGHFRWFGP